MQCLALFMNADNKSNEQNRRKVGVYDRPASADRLRNLRLWIVVIAIILSAFSAYYYFSS